MANPHSVFDPPPQSQSAQWGRLYGAAAALALAELAAREQRLLVVITPDSWSAHRLEQELGFFGADRDLDILAFPDWETLPYDLFSPYQDIISERLTTLTQLPSARSGVLVVPVATLLQRLPPPRFVELHSLLITVGDKIDLDAMRARLTDAGYRAVSQVQEHGEFAVRGALLDLYPMGSAQPLRIDLFDDEVETIRYFDAETQRSNDKVNSVKLLPAKEFPLDAEGISRFRSAFRAKFSGDPQRSVIYREVSAGNAPGGIEYYLPLFFTETASLFDYLPDDTSAILLEEVESAAQSFLGSVADRYEQRRHDPERPLVEPEALYLTLPQLQQEVAGKQQIKVGSYELPGKSGQTNFATAAPPPLHVQARAAQPAAALQTHLEQFAGRVLFCAESAGRREAMLDLLHGFDIRPKVIDGWQAFVESDHSLAITVGSLDRGLVLEAEQISLITEAQILGERAAQTRRRRGRKAVEADAVVRNLTELHPGDPVVHEEHGVGRYQGLQRLEVGGMSGEFLTLTYEGEDKLYVPVSSLHLISRYTGVSPENAPLHRLGGDRWQRVRQRAAKRVRDVAAELLEVYARRAASRGHAFEFDEVAYVSFAQDFPFEETVDQATAIEQVIADMRAEQPMDRVVCGDVGFGKTEVALRATLVAVQGGKQVAVLVPTTLLAQQHFENFKDRFADWPINIEMLSRFRTGKAQEKVLQGMVDGSVDIVIGTHKLLQSEIRFKRLGLVIVDEEHRFGVRHKESLKKLRSEVDLLTLTATPIPRTLNMSLAGIRDLSIIATPPARRVAVKTFVAEWNDALVVEACQRELKRGGQIYLLHNNVATIERKVAEMRTLLPEARIDFAHGQMRERELERVMLDFYHQRFNILVCTTIIESGIDVPNANTIIINRADKLGLAQLHQLRGRVGRSHHRAYAYLVVPPAKVMTSDARKRIEAIESLEDLGAGFMLATHDLEIRGAGELLGDEQSGQIQEIGFNLYSDLLQRAVEALKSGKTDFDPNIDNGVTEVDLQAAALIPDDYLPDVQQRLVLYKRIASAADAAELRELQVEMIDRFGLLPEPTKHLFAITQLKLDASQIGITKIEVGAAGGRILFDQNPKVDPIVIIELLQQQPNIFSFDGVKKLGFAVELDSVSDREDWVAHLLQKLRGADSVDSNT